MKILETLARIEASDQEEPFVHWAQRAAISLSWGATVLVVTPLADDALCQGLHRLVRAGMNVVLLVTEPYANFAVVRERARAAGNERVSRRVGDRPQSFAGPDAGQAQGSRLMTAESRPATPARVSRSCATRAGRARWVARS